jgi:hypothetical protein
MVRPPLKTDRVPEMFREAFAETARQSNLSPAQTGSAIADGDCMECEEFHQRLAYQIALYLAEREPTLRGVYRFDPTFASGEDARIRALPSESSMIELLVWTELRSDALIQEARALQEAFGEERLNWVCPKALEWCHALNIIVVDDRDVQMRHGYAALLDSLWVRPTRVWGKTEIPPRPVQDTALT